MSTYVPAPINTVPTFVPNQLLAPPPVQVPQPPVMPLQPLAQPNSALLQAYQGLPPATLPVPNFMPQNNVANPVAPALNTPFSLPPAAQGPVPGITAEQAAKFLQEMMAQGPNGPQPPVNELGNEAAAPQQPAAVSPEAAMLPADASNGTQPHFVDGSTPPTAEAPESKGFFAETWKKVTAVIVGLAVLIGGYFLLRNKGEDSEETKPEEKKEDKNNPEKPKENPPASNPAPPTNANPPFDQKKTTEELKKIFEQLAKGKDQPDSPEMQKAEARLEELVQPGLVHKEQQDDKIIYTYSVDDQNVLSYDKPIKPAP